jgi:hypothetical protein
MAAVASSALRNYEELSARRTTNIQTYLDKRIALFIIALYGKNWVPGRASTDLHLGHLLVEEIGEIRLIDFWGDAADIQTPRLTRQIWVDSHTHPKRRHRHRRRKTGNGEDRRNLRTIGSRKVEQA